MSGVLCSFAMMRSCLAGKCCSTRLANARLSAATRDPSMTSIALQRSPAICGVVWGDSKVASRKSNVAEAEVSKKLSRAAAWLPCTSSKCR